MHQTPAHTFTPLLIARCLRSIPAGTSLHQLQEIVETQPGGGHLSEGSILRGLGVLAYCRLVTKEKTTATTHAYCLIRLTDEEWPVCEKLLTRLGNRPSPVLKDAVRSGLAALPSLQELDIPQLVATAAAIRQELYKIPLPSLSFFHCVLLAHTLQAKRFRANVSQVGRSVHFYVDCGNHILDPFPEGFRDRALNLSTDITPFLENGVLVMPKSSPSADLYTEDNIILRPEALSWAVQEIRKEQRYRKKDLPLPDPELRTHFSTITRYLEKLFEPLHEGRPIRTIEVSGNFDEIDAKLRDALQDIPDHDLVILALLVNYRDGEDMRFLVDDAAVLKERLRQLRNGDFDAEREEYEFLFDFTVFTSHKTIQISNISIGKPADSEHYRFLRGQKVSSIIFSLFADALRASYPDWRVTTLSVELLKDLPFRIIPYLMQKHFNAAKPQNPYKIDFVGEVNRAFMVDPKYVGSFLVGRVPRA